MLTTLSRIIFLPLPPFLSLSVFFIFSLDIGLSGLIFNLLAFNLKEKKHLFFPLLNLFLFLLFLLFFLGDLLSFTTQPFY